MDDLTNRQKRHLHEVADLMLNIYRTLVRMQYLDPLWIQEGPHDIENLLPLYQSHNLDPAVIYLYSILPYIDPEDAVNLSEELAFFQRSTFADFRKKGDVDQGRDPLYDAEDGEPILREWMTPLSNLGNHGSVIIYDARRHCVAIIDHECGGSFDHGLNHYGRYPDTRWVEGAGCEEEDESSEESGSEGLDDEMLEYGSSEEGSADEMSEDEEEEGSEGSERLYDEMDSRPARHVLKDIVQWYHDLVEIPRGEGVFMWDPEIVIPLYRKHDWPSANFDGDAFLVDQARAAAAALAKSSSEEPIREVWKYQGWIVDDGQKMQRMRDKIASAKTEDEEWLARWEVWDIEQRNQRNRKGLMAAEEARDRACPGGICQKPEELPLWEERQLREEFWSKQSTVETMHQQAKEKGIGERDSVPGINLRLRRAEKKAEIYRKAYEAARLDADRLCPGRSFTSGPGVEKYGLDLKARMDSLTDSIDKLRPEVESIREWMAQLPAGAQQARKEAQNALDKNEKSLKSFVDSRDHVAPALEKLGQ